MNLGVDPRHADQMVRGVCNLPNGSGRTRARRGVRPRRQGGRGQGRRRRHRRRRGPRRDVQGGKIDFDRCIATPDMMPLVGRLGKVLGPARPDAEPEGRHRDDGRRRARSRPPRAARSSSASRRPASCTPASARPRSTTSKLVENIKAFADAVAKAKPAGAKGTYIQRVAISSTMGPGVKVEPDDRAHGLMNDLLQDRAGSREPARASARLLAPESRALRVRGPGAALKRL